MAFCPGMPWGGGYPTGQIIGGLIEELTERLIAMDPPAAETRPCMLENFGPEIIYDHDIATLTMFEMLEEASVGPEATLGMDCWSRIHPVSLRSSKRDI